jgi:hypothetical protein
MGGWNFSDGLDTQFAARTGAPPGFLIPFDRSFASWDIDLTQIGPAARCLA